MRWNQNTNTAFVTKKERGDHPGICAKTRQYHFVKKKKYIEIKWLLIIFLFHHRSVSVLAQSSSETLPPASDGKKMEPDITHRVRDFCNTQH